MHTITTIGLDIAKTVSPNLLDSVSVKGQPKKN
jgi:hypothetical protein